MCLICIDLQKDKLTPKEARRNLGETYQSLDKEHRLEVLRLIWKKEDEDNIEEVFDDYLEDFFRSAAD